MDKKIAQALKYLNKVLPLKDNQNLCSIKAKQLHQKLLYSFVEKGRVLTKEEIADSIGDANELVGELKEKELLVLSEADEVIGVYPFTMEKRQHKIKVNGFEVHAMCALDSLAVSPMFKLETEITSVCEATDERIKIQQLPNALKNKDEIKDLYFGIIWSASNSNLSCANSLCLQMIFLINLDVANSWMMEDIDNREIFKLEDAVEFASEFFVPLME